MEIWAEATRELASDKTEMSMELILKVIQSNTSIPAIIVDDTGEINQYLNLNLPETDTEKYLQEKLEQLKSKSNLIEINLGDGEKQYLYYDYFVKAAIFLSVRAVGCYGPVRFNRLFCVD